MPSTLVEKAPHSSVADTTRLCARDRNDFETMRRAVAVEALPESWRAHFRQQLAKNDV